MDLLQKTDMDSLIVSDASRPSFSASEEVELMSSLLTSAEVPNQDNLDEFSGITASHFWDHNHQSSYFQSPDMDKTSNLNSSENENISSEISDINNGDNTNTEDIDLMDLFGDSCMALERFGDPGAELNELYQSSSQHVRDNLTVCPKPVLQDEACGHESSASSEVNSCTVKNGKTGGTTYYRDRYLEMRKKNNIASRRCRQNRKEKEAAISKQVETLENENKRLKAAVQKLEQERAVLYSHIFSVGFKKKICF